MRELLIFPNSAGLKLGIQDWVKEEILLRVEEKQLEEELLMEMSEEERKLYFGARDRALLRLVDNVIMEEQCDGWYRQGLLAATNQAELSATSLDFVEVETNAGFAFVCAFLSRLEAVKGKGYTASCFKRGEKDGMLVNLQRKFDRIENLMQLSSPADGGETLSQTLGDLAVYATKWLIAQAELRPNEFKAWLEEVRRL